MKMSRRARRMERHHQKAKTPALNLVSLMDIFTILVFFLLVSSSNTQQLPSSKDLRLPTSSSQTVPDETLVIAVTQEDVLVKGISVAKVAEVLAGSNEVIPGLKEELDFLAAGSNSNPAGEGQGRRVTIMGDENISYDLVRKILTTCQQANYTRIAFAAVQKAKPKA
ncbi:biopolymer transporter ExbD [Cellvibrio sp. PSBB006]|uniref:ExbD/TolR family protein n=1 Tax=Cellvibrio sp. PSBB006 TaxID=1987723 RepID=UPI000B3B94BD|nr:biopolymer transporter ExbD [Cellvibrio sp. PSBB006]ARU26516.1 biopolymer transporter ExbD [Cellvibrio sp. PSBB006]